MKTLILILTIFCTSIANANEISVRNSSDICNSSNEGGVRYVAATNSFEGCDGTSWFGLNNNGTVTLKGTRTTTGTWSISGLTINKPLILTMSSEGGLGHFQFDVVSGSDGGQSTDANTFAITAATTTNQATPPSAIIIPTSTTLTLDVLYLGSATVRAYQ